jgi:hypothetical protein
MDCFNFQPTNDPHTHEATFFFRDAPCRGTVRARFNPRGRPDGDALHGVDVRRGGPSDAVGDE